MVHITPEMIESANTYIPLLEKAKLAEEIAKRSVKAVEFSYTPAKGGAPIVMPPGAQEIPFLTHLFLMGVLAAKYLKQGAGWDDDMLMPLNLYDEWGESHVMNQLERLKGNKAVANRVYDILSDYKELKWMVRSAIETRVNQASDLVSRLHQMWSEAMDEIDPANVQDTMEQIAQLEQRYQKSRPQLEESV